MTKEEIKKLALASFIKNNLDPKKVKKIAGKMKRRELRDYIKYLKYYDLAKKVVIIVPSIQNLEPELKQRFSELFPDKKIVFREDPQLLLGIKIINNDRIFDFNLKNSFENITSFMGNL